MRGSLTAVFPALALAASLSIAPNAQAQLASSDLGVAFPPTANLSQDPFWRVYALQREGVRYYQLNDPSGSVHAAFASAGGAVLVLPLGVDEAKVSVAPANPSWDTSRSVVYTSPQLSLDVTTAPDGSIQSIVVKPKATTSEQNASQRKSNMQCAGYDCGINQTQIDSSLSSATK